MQSSGVGNTINALALLATCRMPLLTIVSMRGEWGEGNPWQVPAGMGAPKAMEAMGVALFRASEPENVAETVTAAARIAFSGGAQTAVLLSQRLIGAKSF
jgi:sulfopyruvate decarboxylase TPP-binding subunit